MMLIWLMVAIFIYLDYENAEEGDDGDRRRDDCYLVRRCLDSIPRLLLFCLALNWTLPVKFLCFYDKKKIRGIPVLSTYIFIFKIFFKVFIFSL